MRVFINPTRKREQPSTLALEASETSNPEQLAEVEADIATVKRKLEGKEDDTGPLFPELHKKAQEDGESPAEATAEGAVQDAATA